MIVDQTVGDDRAASRHCLQTNIKLRRSPQQEVLERQLSTIAQVKIVDKTSSGKPRIGEGAEDLAEDEICAALVFTPLRVLEAIIPGGVLLAMADNKGYHVMYIFVYDRY